MIYHPDITTARSYGKHWAPTEQLSTISSDESFGHRAPDRCQKDHVHRLREAGVDVVDGSEQAEDDDRPSVRRGDHYVVALVFFRAFVFL